MNRIDGKIAVITGGTQGLGAAVARLFAAAGAARIVIVGRGLDKGRAVASAITAQTGVPVEMVGADLENIDDGGAIIGHAGQRFGRGDLLVNDAGLPDRGSILHTTPARFSRM